MLTCTAYSHQMDPVWLNAESRYCTLMKLNLRVQHTASLLCLHGIPHHGQLEKCTALKKTPQISQGLLTSPVCSAMGDRPLLDLCWSVCARFAVLLQHSIRTLPVVKYIMFYSLPVSYISWDGGGKKRRQEIGFEPMRPKFYSWVQYPIELLWQKLYSCIYHFSCPWI